MNPKDRNLVALYSKTCPPHTHDTITQINTIDYILDMPNLKETQTKDAYCRCTKQSLHIPSVKNIFKLDNGSLYRQKQDGYKALRH